MSSASVVELGERASIAVDGEQLETPAGTAMVVSLALADAMAEELVEDGVADVTRPSLFAFRCAELDFIAPDPDRTVHALIELLAHDYLLHPSQQLGRRQVQVAAWEAQIALWRRVSGREPPYAPAGGEPDVRPADITAFHAELEALTPSQLSVAIHAANILKSATLGILLAERAIDPDTALRAAAATLRVDAGDTQEDLEREDEMEDALRSVIDRLRRYAELTAGRLPH